MLEAVKQWLAQNGSWLYPFAALVTILTGDQPAPRRSIEESLAILERFAAAHDRATREYRARRLKWDGPGWNIPGWDDPNWGE